MKNTVTAWVLATVLIFLGFAFIRAYGGGLTRTAQRSLIQALGGDQ